MKKPITLLTSLLLLFSVSLNMKAEKCSGGLILPDMPDMPHSTSVNLPFVENVLTSDWTDEPLNWNLITVSLDENANPSFHYPVTDWSFDTRIGATSTDFSVGALSAMLLPVLNIPATTTSLKLKADISLDGSAGVDGFCTLMMTKGNADRYSGCVFMQQMLENPDKNNIEIDLPVSDFTKHEFDLKLPSFLDGEERTLNIVLLFMQVEAGQVIAIKNVEVFDPALVAVEKTETPSSMTLLRDRLSISDIEGSARLYVQDMTGRMILTSDVRNGSEINMAQKGLYVVHLVQGGKVSSAKWMVY